MVLTGLGSFARLCPGGQEMDEILDRKWRSWEAGIIKKMTDLSESLHGPHPSRQSLSIGQTLNILTLLGLAIVLTFTWILRQFLSTWAIGPGTPRITTIVYLGYLVWNIFDAISAKVLNQSILESSGTRWGFGQILPLVLLLAVMFNGLKAGP